MKKISLSLLLLGLCFGAYAQQEDQTSYYYRGEKVYYPVSYDRVVVGVAPQASFRTLQRTIAKTTSVSLDSITESYPGKQILIKLGKGRTKADAAPIMDAVRALENVLYARPVFISSSGAYNSYGTDFIVQLKSTTTLAQVQELMAANGCTLVRKFPFGEDLYILAAGEAVGYDALEQANLFYETGLFEYAEPDKVVYDAQHVAPPNDPMFALQWAHANAGTSVQYSGAPGADVKVQQAWDITRGQPYIKVGVIDEGVDLTHPDLQANLLQGFNGATLTSNPGDGAPLGPARAHGTACAGIIAALADNNTGVAGIAPACKIIPAVIFGAMGTYLGDAAVAAAFDYCRLQGASVISSSWGGGAVSSTIDAAISRAVTLGRNGKGCLVLFSSGNSNGAVSYPATNPSVVAVGGVTMCNERKAPASCDGETWGANYGTGLDVAAPCVKIATTDIQGTGGYNATAGTAGNYNATFNGTSSACPNAAGVAALIFSVDSNLTGAQARQILEASCDKVLGYAFAANAAQPASTWNSSVGYGRVNALSAVQLASTGQFCTVQIQAASLTHCNGTTGIAVLNPDATATYGWRRNGVLVGSGTSYSAPSAGVYEAVISKGACSAASTPVTLQPTFSLQATASSDTVCTGGVSTLTAAAALPSTLYCVAAYSTGAVAGNYISLVSIPSTTLANASAGATAYPYHTVYSQPATTATLTANSATPYALTVKGGTHGQCYVRAWIDYNRDGVFSAAESIGVSTNVGAQAQANISFTVPATALNGATRLRLRSTDVASGPAAGAACTTLGYGETEDYVITIAGGTEPAFTYAWTSTPANGTLIGTAAQVTAADIPANTTYTVTATNWAGCVAAASVEVATSNTWTGAVSTAWNIPGNWSCNAVPGAGANIVIPITANQPHLTGAATVGGLSLHGVLHLADKSLTLGGPVTGAGTFSGSALSSMVVAGAAGELRFTPGAGLLYGFMLESGASASVGTNIQLGP